MSRRHGRYPRPRRHQQVSCPSCGHLVTDGELASHMRVCRKNVSNIEGELSGATEPMEIPTEAPSEAPAEPKNAKCGDFVPVGFRRVVTPMVLSRFAIDIGPNGCTIVPTERARGAGFEGGPTGPFLSYEEASAEADRLDDQLDRRVADASPQARVRAVLADLLDRRRHGGPPDAEA